MAKKPAIARTPEEIGRIMQLAMLQFSPDEIEALMAPVPTDPEAAYVRGILEGQRAIRSALMNNASNGDTAAITAFIRLIAKQ